MGDERRRRRGLLKLKIGRERLPNSVGFRLGWDGMNNLREHGELLRVNEKERGDGREGEAFN